ncbi:hypothetical protein ACFVW8_00085 [Streptomyces sp. NPDC058221]|uniref:hypothetical protein n=1 Tax=Streptomyces sp. NPDC058221 TaxID=3346388 RepID=UPI0036ED1B8B
MLSSTAAPSSLQAFSGQSVSAGRPRPHPADLALVHVIHIEQGRDQAGQFVLFVFATDTWAGELTNAEPDKHLAAQWITADRLPEPAFPTSAQALAAYRNGGPVFSRYGWSVTAAR